MAPHTVEFSEDSTRQLSLLSARDRRIVLDAIEEQLAHQPATPTRNRKKLRQASLADWELRVGKYRVFYRVEETKVTVVIVAIGVKDSSRLLIEGKEVKL